MSGIDKGAGRVDQREDARQRGRSPDATPARDTHDDSLGPTRPRPAFELNLRALARAGYLTPEQMQGRQAEQYRHIKRPILKNITVAGEDPQEHRNLIAVTSALRGEGKTFTAFNLAVSMSMERDFSVLLVDTDLIARSLTTLAGMGDAPGLTDVLVDPRVTLDDVIVRTNVPKIGLIPAGRVRQNTTELLASERMRDVADELSRSYSKRVVLFDTAPILITSQALVLDALVGQVVVVVDEGKTPQQAIQDAVSLLEKNKDVGILLNKSRRSSPSNYSPYYGEPV
jgi:exopolysaccharide/PEP-CTERM locus tyrosine autokinase